MLFRIEILWLSCLWFLGVLLNPVYACAFKNENMQPSTPDSQFVDNGDGTIIHKATGLMWKKCSEGITGDNCEIIDESVASYSWQDAFKQAKLVNEMGGFAGYNDWRLPNIKELASIVEEQCYQPSINEKIFPNTFADFYWSSTPDMFPEDNGGYAWAFSFENGEMHAVRKSISSRYPTYLRLVRNN